FMWFDNIGGGLDSAFQNLLLKKTSVLDIIPLHRKEIKSIFRPCRDSQRTLCLKGWKAVWHMIEKIYTTAVDYGNLLKEEKKGQGKRRALSELLMLLESNGLSRQKSAYTGDRDAGNTELRAKDDSTANEHVDGNCNDTELSPFPCILSVLVGEVSNQLSRLYLKFVKRNPGYDGK
ncbi:hypothetical protein V8G54_027108, partial [Vigna mungo]